MLFSQLFESNELATVTAHKINALTTKRVEDFQALSSEMADFLERDAPFTPESVDALIDVLDGFKSLDFAARAIKQLGKIRADFDTGEAAKRNHRDPEQKSKRKQHADELEAALLGGDYDAFDTIGDVLSALYAGTDKVDTQIDKETRDIMRWTFTKGTGLFSSSSADDPLREIDASTYRKVASVDLSTHNFSYIEFPRAMTGSPEFMAAFILNLTTGPNPKRIEKPSDLRRHTKQNYANSARFQELLEMVRRYLQNNDRAMIPKIMQELQRYPELVKANNIAKRKIKTVYRGIPDYEGDLTGKGIVAKDRESQFVATSDSRSVAMNFAKAKGHLDSNASVESGWIITYDASDAVLLVTSILGTVYGESEIIVDATKAGVVDVEWYDFS